MTSRYEDRLRVLRQHNKAQCFDWLSVHGPATLAELAAGTQLSRPTVKEHLRKLIEAGLATELATKAGSQRAGRPATAYVCNADAGFVVGCDLGKHQDRVLIANMAGKVITVGDRDADAAMPAEERLTALAAWVGERIGEAGLDRSDLVRAGLALPAIINTEGTVVRSLVFPDWAGMDMARRTEDLLATEVVIENDLTAACLAEHRIGVARHVQDVVFVLAWYQLAAGIILGGELRRGRHFVAGELNQVAASAAAGADRGWDSWPSVRELLKRSVLGHAAAAESIRAFVSATATQIGYLTAAIDPDLVILGGPLIEGDNVLADLLVERVHGELGEEVVIVPSALGPRAPVCGVALLALDCLRADLFGVDDAALTRAALRGFPARITDLESAG